MRFLPMRLSFQKSREMQRSHATEGALLSQKARCEMGMERQICWKAELRDPGSGLETKLSVLARRHIVIPR